MTATGDGEEPLWLRNGPGYPIDVCFDFQNGRILLLNAVGPSFRGGGAFGMLAMRNRAWKNDYEMVEELTPEERVQADRDSIVIPFGQVISLTLGKRWGRPPILLLETRLSMAGGRSSGEPQYTRRHELTLASNRGLQAEQIARIRRSLPRSLLGTRFEDKIG